MGSEFLDKQDVDYSIVWIAIISAKKYPAIDAPDVFGPIQGRVGGQS